MKRKWLSALIGGVVFLASATIHAQAPRRLASAPIDREDPNTVVFSRFQFTTLTSGVPDRWDVMPDFDDILLDYVARNTNLKISKKSWNKRVIRVDDAERMYTNPLLFMTGEGDFRLSEKEAATLGEYFKRGGFLYADDCYADDAPHDQFFRAFLREIKKTLPGLEMEPVPYDHAIYHCFYDFNRGAPWCKGVRHRDMGLFYEGKLVAFLTPGDVHCGWGNRYTPEGLQEPCLKFGVNIIVYALTH